MKKEEKRRAAIEYREQIQERHHKETYLESKLLLDGCEHVRNTFPGSFDDETFPLEALYNFFVEQGIDDAISLSNLASLLTQEIEDLNHPLRSFLVDSETKFDSFLSSAVTVDYLKDIKSACDELGLYMRDGVSAGLTQMKGVQAEQRSVFLTDSSVINVTESLYLITHRVSKLLAKSLAFEFADDKSYQISSDFEEYKALLLSDEELQKQWNAFFVDCSSNLAAPPTGGVVSLGGIHVQNCFVDIKDAIMLFIIGHECGHHIHQHSSSFGDQVGSGNQHDEFKMEYQADIVGSQLTMSIGRRESCFNLFAATSIGAICILKTLDYIKIGHDILLSGVEDVDRRASESHPATKDRIGILKAYIEHHEYEENSAQLSLRLIQLFEDVLDFIWLNTKNNLKALHDGGARPVKLSDSQWLP